MSEQTANNTQEAATQAVPSMGELVKSSASELFGKPKAEPQASAEPPPSEPKHEEPVKQDAKPEEAQKPEQQKERKQEPVKRKFDKLTRKLRETESENVELRRKLEAYEKKRGEAPNTEGMSDKDASKAELKHELSLEHEAREIERMQQEATRKRAEAFSEAVEELIPQEEREQFITVYNANRDYIVKQQPELASFALESAVGPVILHEFLRDVAQDENNLASWEARSPYAKRMLLAQAESAIIARMTSSGEQVAREPQAHAPAAKSAAPKPIAPESAKAAPGGGDASFAGMYNASKRAMFGRGR